MKGSRGAGKRKYNRELIDRAREIFIASDLNFRQFSEASQALVGQFIPPDALDLLSANDPEGDWQVAQAERIERERSPEGEEPAASPLDATTPAEEIAFIRRAVYRRLTSQAGFFLALTAGEEPGDLEKEIKRRLADLPLKVIKANPNVDASLVNAYFNALQKSGIKIDLGAATAKTSQQRALELVEVAVAGLPADIEAAVEKAIDRLNQVHVVEIRQPEEEDPGYTVGVN